MIDRNNIQSEHKERQNKQKHVFNRQMMNFFRLTPSLSAFTSTLWFLTIAWSMWALSSSTQYKNMVWFNLRLWPASLEILTASMHNAISFCECHTPAISNLLPFWPPSPIFCKISLTSHQLWIWYFILVLYSLVISSTFITTWPLPFPSLPLSLHNTFGCQVFRLYTWASTITR
jgi:hypothetical protein